MARVDLKSKDAEVLEQTLKDLLGKEYLFQPMSAENVITAIEMLPFNLTIYFNKITGNWSCGNLEDQVRDGATVYFGVNFSVTDYTMEKACARAIHYYYHLKLRE